MMCGRRIAGGKEMSNPMNIEVEVRDIKQCVIEISKKIDDLMYEREITAMMKLSDKSLSGLFEDEKDLYKISDLKVRYK
jgi:hypothetical protein